jgi:hypothetical protein
VRQFFDVTYETSGGTGTLQIDACVEVEGETNYAYDGTFTLTTPRGATLIGAMTGTLEPQFIPVPFDAVLTAQTGTRELRRVTGSIDMNGTWTLFDPDTTQGPTAGTLSGELARITGAGASF